MNYPKEFDFPPDLALISQSGENMPKKHFAPAKLKLMGQ